MATTIAIFPSSARADSADSSDQPPCSVEERCPDSGVECIEDDDQAAFQECIDGAKAKGLEFRCDDNSQVFCSPDEEIYVEDEGCAVRSPRRPSQGLPIAVATCAIAVAATFLRRRLAKPR